MRERQGRQYEALHSIASHLRRTRFTNPRILYLKDELLAHDERVWELMAENARAKREPQLQVGRRRLTKDGLREKQLIPLSRRGRKLARVHPELTSALKVPHKNASVTELADAAERIADALTPHLQFLIEAKWPRNCLNTLRQDARALRAHADTVAESRELLGRSNRELTAELSAARQTLREFDSVLRSLDDYPSYKIGWESLTGVHARMGRPTKRRLAARERSAARHRRSTDGEVQERR